ncbi:spore cortex biosynthesis protein YabQ [Paenibacillus eucommiae]|uniref:Spore cortex biosynthesis protein YabQ n=1 Tax=Paenibacillus eucommiae TaxID=1355755 RepID=A0ABS4J8M4_9BACL|nr:spore cortex biosynthesis protein YabQ [Paenibacillus eucommiae]MBP1996165.1 spore cortex biosynthesis protein YabQ [Paenibacillus eucommiae]
MTLHVQFFTIFMMFCSGLALGTLFDVFRVLFGKLRLPRFILPFADIVFWVVATGLVFWLLLYSNEGQVRVFVFLGIGIGICCYFALLSHWIIWLILLFIRIAVSLYRFAKKMVELFLIKPIVGIYRLTLVIFGFLFAVAVFLYKIVLQLLYPLWRLLLWIIQPLLKLHFWHIPTQWIKNIAGFFRRFF